MTTEQQFSQHSIDITKKLTKQEKKDGGIFLTPKIIRQKQIDRTLYWVDRLKIKPKLIVEPSCGSGEFLIDLDRVYKKKQFIGVEKNETIFKHISEIKLVTNNNLALSNQDYLQTHIENCDIIIGNPPYFVISNHDVPDEYREYVSGRPNIYCLFILHGLKMLNNKKTGGILSFIIPKSILNSVYYDGVRRHIFQNYNLLDIIDYGEDNRFIDTDQETIGIIISNNKTVEPDVSFYLEKPGAGVLFTLDRNALQDIYKNSTTLKELGLAVKTGSIVWNQVKDRLTDDSDKTILLYNSNVKNNSLEVKKFKNDAKKQYINIDRTEVLPFIVVNRGRGNAQFSLDFCKIDNTIVNQNVLVENHLNIIYNKTNTDPEILDKIICSLQDERTRAFLSIFAGNNSLSKTELETLLPIYI